MSLAAHLWALDRAPVTNPTAVLVLVALSDEAADDGTGACPYIDKMILRARASKRSVQNHLRELYRMRLIDFGDPSVAMRRYKKKSPHLCPRVWDVNMTATWDNVPEPRTDEEMLTYSDTYGQKPVRRGGAESAPLLDDAPDETGGADSAPPVGAESAPGGVQPVAPGGVQPVAPGGVQPVAPFPLVPASSRPPQPPTPPPPPSEHRLEEGGSSQQKKPPEMAQVVSWFVDRTKWRADDIEAALSEAVDRRWGSLTEAAHALRELADGVYDHIEGPTDSPRRLCARENAPWWSTVRAKRAIAAAAARAASPRCRRPGHETQPEDGCVHCKGEAIARADDDQTPTHPAAGSKDPDRFVRRYASGSRRVRQRDGDQSLDAVAP